MTRFNHNPTGKIAIAALAALVLTGCTTLGASGPSSGTLRGADSEEYEGANISVVELDRAATARLSQFSNARSFAEIFGDPEIGAPLVERGDIVGVTIWEAPPAVLFGADLLASDGTGRGTAQSSSIPDLRVDEDGMLSIPFVGEVAAAGRTPSQIQADILRRLEGRANDPQALVRLVGNRSSNVTVMGKVAATRRVPLTSSGERLLDVLAEAGGPTVAVETTTVRVTRGSTAVTMPLDAVILDPEQNIPLQADDVLTVYHQPYSFIALGAVARNAEIPFEGSGLSLAQALGRIGGLQDDRADVRGVFIFRFEDKDALDPALAATAEATQDGRVPVIYRLNLSDATGLFLAQDFAMRDDDVIYVSNAPGADLRKFISTLSNVALSTIAVSNSLQN